MTSTSGDKDEWVFTIKHCCTDEDDAVQLRQRQPHSNHRSFREESVQVFAADDGGDDLYEEESAALLKANNNNTEPIHQKQQHETSSSSSAAAWSLQSPFWSIQNGSALLKVTYCPAWQALPEYTQQCRRACCTSNKSTAGLLARACSVKLCGKLTAVEIEYIAETFYASDIVRIEQNKQQHQMINIQGIGMCQTIKVFLRPMTAAADAVMPSYLKEAWEDHVERMMMRKQNAQTNNNEEEQEEMMHNGPVLTFCLATEQTDPPLLWKVWLPEIPDFPIAVRTITVLDGAVLLTTKQAAAAAAAAAAAEKSRAPPRAKARAGPRPTHIYINGYQSWSFTGSLLRGRLQPTSAMPGMFSRAFNLGGSPPPEASTLLSTTTAAADSDNTAERRKFKKWYQSDFFTCITSDGSARPTFSERRFPYQQLDETGGPALILGWISQHEQFGVVTVNRDLSRYEMHCSVDGQILMRGCCNGGAISTDWAYAQLVHPHSYDEEPMANFLHAVAAYNRALPLQNGSLLTGWCSWYVFYENINAGLLRENISKLAAMRDQVPTNVAVVDDGYMTAWGDWDSLKPNDFAGGMDVVSRDISSHGMRPGIWLAPFAADKKSQLVKDHPDWIIRNDQGLPANSSNCGKFFYGLDATNPDVRAHVHESIRRAVEDWGFDVLKIDFLYAACLEGNGKYDLSISRAQAMHLALKTIRDAAGPGVFLIGCGCPIASGIGYVDAMRISADTGPTWYPALPLPWWDNGTLPALRSMVRNSIARAPFGHRWWHNDPDCLMLGEHTSLSDDEVASAATVVAMTCGMLLLSDDLPKLRASRREIVSKIFPLTGVTATVLDLHSTNDGLPSLMRLWCTDKYNMFDSFRNSMAIEDNGVRDHNAEATFYARMASFHPDEEPSDPTERMRSCIHVTKGMGTWTVVSISNWSDRSAVVRVPPPALEPPPRHGWGADLSDESSTDGQQDSAEASSSSGYHVFGFWSSKYSWLAEHNDDERSDPDQTVCKNLRPHETEVFHIKRVTPNSPQYIGSDFHFSCGFEVRLFRAQKNSVNICLKNDYHRAGYIFVFLPRVNIERAVKVMVNGERGMWDIIGNTPQVASNGSPRLVGRVIRVAVVIHSDGRPHDGQVMIEF